MLWDEESGWGWEMPAGVEPVLVMEWDGVVRPTGVEMAMLGGLMVYRVGHC